MNPPNLRRLACLGVLSLLAAGPLLAERLIPFQGRVTDAAGDPLQGVYRVTFAIYDAETGGTPLEGWVETHEEVSILAGQINVFLGSRRSLDDPNGDANTADAIGFSAAEGPRYLGIKIGEDTNQEMVPRHELLPSFHARVADRVIDEGITTDQIADGAVTTVKLDPTAGLPVGGVVMWWGEEADIPDGFEVCDGQLPSTPGALLVGAKPDLRDRIPMGAGGTVAPDHGFTSVGNTSFYSASSVGDTTLTEAQMATHRHTGGAHNHYDYGGLSLGNGDCQVSTATGDPGPDGQQYRRMIGYAGPPPKNVYRNCPEAGVDVTFPPVAGGVGIGIAQPIVDFGTRDQPHTHSLPTPPVLAMHFIIRVK